MVACHSMFLPSSQCRFSSCRPSNILHSAAASELLCNLDNSAHVSFKPRPILAPAFQQQDF